MTLRVLQFGTTGQLAREMLARQDASIVVTALSRGRGKVLEKLAKKKAGEEPAK